MVEQKDLVAYAEEWASYVLLKLAPADFKKINNIILFGSVARGDFGEDSDVDIFVDVAGGSKDMEKKIKNASESFSASKFRKRLELLGIKNEIHPITGVLKEWKETEYSIILNGISLYGKYIPAKKKGMQHAVLYWEPVKSGKRLLLNSRLFGYSHAGRRYPGIIENLGGEKLGPRCIIVPLDGYQKAREIFRQMKIPVKMRTI